MNKKIDFLNFDSINAVTTSNDSFDTTFTLAQKYKNIHKIYLKNCEIPIGFPNIRQQNLSNTFSISFYNNLRTDIQILTGVYSTISSLLTGLNSQISNALLPFNCTLVLSATTDNKIKITSTGSGTYSIITNTLSKILGLTFAINQNLGTLYSSPYVYNLAYDTFMQMSFYNIPSIYSSQGNIPSALKIPLNTNTYNILFYSTSRELYDQSLKITDSNFILSQMRIIMYDRYGYALNNGGLDYSFTLAIEYYDE
jgi:hypothetical protein